MSRIAAEVLGAIPFPALVLEVPSERIVASSPAATRLLDPAGGMAVGHFLEEFTADRPAPGADLFAGGRLNGFETFRTLLRLDGDDVKIRMWIRSFARQPATDFVVVVLVADVVTVDGPPPADWREAPAVVGTANSSLLIERISNDAEELFNVPVAQLLGSSLLALVAPDAVPGCLSALSEASASQNGVTLHLDIRTGFEAPALRCEVLILPLEPSPSCAFVFLPIPDGTGGGHDSGELSAILLRLGRGAEVAQLARGVFRGVSERRVPGLSRLTTRELEIVNRLLEGDRAPAIARSLFLSQSTVRNHLASVFAKLGVNSQQELLDVFRAA
ncbi:MAG: Response regulator containing a CheY-like receiver domain and an DNA-binding domain [Pseudonocardiales bacterium]|nr:Response regulator containing a CheY-like receiver domain and an DNA-binding domain [Pseudonocardiales bacterium]